MSGVLLEFGVIVSIEWCILDSIFIYYINFVSYLKFVRFILFLVFNDFLGLGREYIWLIKRW